MCHVVEVAKKRFKSLNPFKARFKMKTFKKTIKKIMLSFFTKHGYELRRHRPKSSRPISLTYLEALIAMRYSEVKSDFRFLQIGANDGVSADPLYEIIATLGLEGVLVEPVPLAFAELQKSYKNNSKLTLVNAGVASENGRHAIYMLKDNETGKFNTKVSTFDRSSMDAYLRRTGLSNCTIVEEIVRTLTPDTLLNETGIQALDLLTVDAEGYDHIILNLFPLQRVQPSIISYEYIRMKEHERLDLEARLIDHGYAVTYFARDTIACHEDSFGYLGGRTGEGLPLNSKF